MLTVARTKALLIAVAVILTTLLILAGPLASADPLPQETLVLDLPGMPHSKAAADIDRDGDTDLIVATHNTNPSTPGTGLFLFAGPTFKVRRTLATGSYTTDLAIADINNDGRKDIVTTTQQGQLTAFIQTPNVNFTPSPIASGIKGHDVEIAQLNSSPTPEIITRGSNSFSATGQGDTVRIFSRNSNGTYTQTQRPVPKGEGLAVGDVLPSPGLEIVAGTTILSTNTSITLDYGYPHTKAHTADLNNDNRTDIILASVEPGTSPNPTPTLTIYFNTNSGLQRQDIDTLSNFVHGLATLDYNQDQHLDIVAAEMEQSPQKRVIVYFGPSFIQQQVISTDGSHNIFAADIDNNGTQDLIGANHGWDIKNANHLATPIQAWRNVRFFASPSFQRSTLPATTSVRNLFVLAADFNGDGINDPATGNRVYTPTPVTFPSNFIAALAADVDADGDQDIFGTEQTALNPNQLKPRQLVLQRNNGHGQFTRFAYPNKAKGDFLQGIVFLPADRKIVLSWHHETSPNLQVLNLVNNAITNLPLSDHEGLSTLDYNQDGRTDLFTGRRILTNTGTTFQTALTLPTADKPDRNLVADINGDSNQDLIVGYEAIGIPGPLTAYNLNGTLIRSHTFIGPMSLGAGDIDQDGDIDLAVGEHGTTNTASLSLYWIEDGTTPHAIYTGDEHHDGALLTDIDGDTDLDIVSIGWTTKVVTVYTNDLT